MFRNCLALQDSALFLTKTNTATAPPVGRSYCVHAGLVCKLLVLSVFNKLRLDKDSSTRSWARKPDTPRRVREGHGRKQILEALAEL